MEPFTWISTAVALVGLYRQFVGGVKDSLAIRTDLAKIRAAAPPPAIVEPVADGTIADAILQVGDRVAALALELDEAHTALEAAEAEIAGLKAERDMAKALQNELLDRLTE